jgi:hypothetical protein
MQAAFSINLPIADGAKELVFEAIACPNPECRKLAIEAELFQMTFNPFAMNFRKTSRGERIVHWNLFPGSHAKVFPEYIPKQLRTDYEEACKIKDLSPKASATLCRRCLQGMIRDFWKIKRARLKDEIEALKGQIDGHTWNAIDSVREIGNIGAHMEAHVNLIIDVEPEEAQLLIGLVERLFEDWYVDREEKQKTNAALINTAAQKKQAKKPQSGTSAQP